jgi:hypothetical protein
LFDVLITGKRPEATGEVGLVEMDGILSTSAVEVFFPAVFAKQSRVNRKDIGDRNLSRWGDGVDLLNASGAWHRFNSRWVLLLRHGGLLGDVLPCDLSLTGSEGVSLANPTGNCMACECAACAFLGMFFLARLRL